MLAAHSLSYDHFVELIQRAWLGKYTWGVDLVWGLLSGFMVEARGMGVALHISVKAVVLSLAIFYNSCRKWTLLMLILRGEYKVLMHKGYSPYICWFKFNANWLYICTWWYIQALFFTLFSNHLNQRYKFNLILVNVDVDPIGWARSSCRFSPGIRCLMSTDFTLWYNQALFFCTDSKSFEPKL